MKNNHRLLLLIIPLVLSACTPSLSPEKAATTTIPAEEATVQITDIPVAPTDHTPTVTPDPVDRPNISDQELLDTMDDIDDLNLDEDFQDLDSQLN